MKGYGDLAELVTFRPLERPLTGAGTGERQSPFRADWSTTVADLAGELRAVDATDVVLQIDVTEAELRLDGLPRASARPGSPGVVLSFRAMDVDGSPSLRYAVATYSTWQDNMRAIALGLRALRAVDRYGVTTSGEQYAGWRALPAPGVSVERGRELIRAHGSIAAALRATHPDTRSDGAGAEGPAYDDEDFLAVRAAQDAAGGA